MPPKPCPFGLTPLRPAASQKESSFCEEAKWNATEAWLKLTDVAVGGARTSARVRALLEG
jgi:hypothetical protein